MTASTCPRCGMEVARGDANHDYVCLETMLMALYQVGVKRGLQGEATEGSFDDQGAGMISEVLAMAWAWREEALGRRAAAVEQAYLRTRPGEEDIDTQVARFLAWENVGWFGQQPVSGEAAWYDHRVVRRRFSQRLPDAALVQRHHLLSRYSLIQVHRTHNGCWEWHMAAANLDGHFESLVREATAPMAVCKAALKLARGSTATEPLVG